MVPQGARVKMTAEALRMELYGSSKIKTGVIKGHARSAGLVRVWRDGKKYPETYSSTFWELDVDETALAVHGLNSSET